MAHLTPAMRRIRRQSIDAVKKTLARWEAARNKFRPDSFVHQKACDEVAKAKYRLDALKDDPTLLRK